jgi:hypothetical protein
MWQSPKYRLYLPVDNSFYFICTAAIIPSGVWVKQEARVDGVHASNFCFPNHYRLTDEKYQGHHPSFDTLDTFQERGSIR